MLGNGHHRFAAAILLGLDDVLVYFSDDNNYMHCSITTPDGYDNSFLPCTDVDHTLLAEFAKA